MCLFAKRACPKCLRAADLTVKPNPRNGPDPPKIGPKPSRRGPLWPGPWRRLQRGASLVHSGWRNAAPEKYDTRSRRNNWRARKNLEPKAPCSNGLRRQLKRATTRRGSIALRGDLRCRWGRASRVDFQFPGDFFRARCPPGCLPPAPKLRTFDRGRPAGGGPSGQGLCPWTPRFAWHAGHKNLGLAGHYGGILRGEL